MKRAIIPVAALALFACSSDKPAIQLFQAAPDTIADGDSTQLIFDASAANKLTIDNGVGEVTGKTSVTVKPAATTRYTLTASHDSDSVTSAVTVTVVPAQAVGFSVARAGTADAVAGAPQTFTVMALNGSGAIQPGFRGTVHFSSDDAAATLPADYAFTAADAGSHAVSVTFKTAGARVLTATDTSARGAQGISRVIVIAAGAAQLALSGIPSQALAGDVFTATVTAHDAFGNVAAGYRGTVHFSSPDTQAALPLDAAFTAADAGARSFALSLRTASAASLTVTDTAAAQLTASASVVVGWGSSSRIAIAGVPATATVDQAVVATLTVGDAFGNTVQNFAGTLRISLSDGLAPAVPDVVFAPSDQGSRQVSFTFATAGAQTVSAQDLAHPSPQSSVGIDVKHGAAAGYALSALPASATAGRPLTLTITAVDAHGNPVKDYAGVAHASSSDSTDLLPADGSFAQGVRVVSLAFTRAAAHTARVSEVGGTIFADTSNVAVKAAAAASISVSGLPADARADDALTAAVTVKDVFGNVVKDYAGTLHFVLTDLAAPAISDQTLTAGAQGTTSVLFTFYTAGAQSLMVSDTARASVSGSSEVTVHNEAAAGYALSGLPIAALAGEPLPLTITAVDIRNNVAVDYAAAAHVASVVPSDLLPADGSFTGGVRTVSLAFVSAGVHAANVSEVGGAITANTSEVSVQAADAAELVVAAAATTAGAGTTIDVTAVDLYSNVAASYGGTVHFTSSDAQAALPADYTFQAIDAGKHSFAATLKTAGSQTVTLADAGGVGGSGPVNVTPANADACSISQLPAQAAAGAQLAARVTAFDPFGNVATGYTGTLAVTADDPAAQITPAVTYQAADAGSRITGVTLVTAGGHLLTATDSSAAPFICTANVAVVPGATVLALTLPANANAGSPQPASVRAQDAFGNAVAGFNQTVHFASSDPLAVIPPDLTFTGSESNSTATTSITFNTVGSQSLGASQLGAPAVTGSATSTVHGFVYTNPNSSLGKAQLVLNAAASSASVVQLDLIANTQTFASGGRNGAYSAGMNLPFDPTRATGESDPTLLVEPASTVRILNTGSAPKAVAAFIVNTGPASAILYSGISQKKAGAGAVTSDVGITLGRVFYSLRMRLTPGAATGTVFDGNALPATFRAAVRDRSVSDVIGQADFAIGKLEVK